MKLQVNLNFLKGDKMSKLNVRMVIVKQREWVRDLDMMCQTKECVYDLKCAYYL